MCRSTVGRGPPEQLGKIPRQARRLRFQESNPRPAAGTPAEQTNWASLSPHHFSFLMHVWWVYISPLAREMRCMCAHTYYWKKLRKQIQGNASWAEFQGRPISQTKCCMLRNGPCSFFLKSAISSTNAGRGPNKGTARFFLKEKGTARWNRIAHK